MRSRIARRRLDSVDVERVREGRDELGGVELVQRGHDVDVDRGPWFARERRCERSADGVDGADRVEGLRDGPGHGQRIDGLAHESGSDRASG